MRPFVVMLLALAAAPLACSSTKTESAPEPDAGVPTEEEDAGGIACPGSGVSKGPWSLAMTRTSVKVRWEACRGDAVGGVVVRPEAGGAELKVASATKVVTLTERHRAPLNYLKAADDAPGTVTMHEAAVTALTPGTCYRYELEADRALGGRFCTAQPDDARVHFLAIGDTNPLLGPATSKVLSNVLSRTPDFVLHGGDIQYYDSGLETWAAWFPVMQPLLAAGSLQPALGNHELETPDEMEFYSGRFFGDEAYGGKAFHYRFESGGVFFHMLNTEEDIDPSSPQGQWLLQSLADAQTQPGFRASVVAMHRPFVTCGDTGQADAARKGFASAFAQYKVPLVIQAHVHIYERFEIDGVTFVTSGGGGGLLGKDDASLSREECAQRKSSGPFFHGVDFVVEGSTIHGQVLDEANAVRDDFTITLP